MLSGVGRLALLTKSLSSTTIAQEIMIPGLFSNFNLNYEVENKKAVAWIEGVKQNVRSAVGMQQATLNLAFQFLDWSHLQLAAGELATNVNVTLPLYKTITVPGTPFEVTDADITSATIASGIKAYVTNRGDWGEAGYLSYNSGTLAAREFKGDYAPADPGPASNKIIFHSGLEGATVTYVVNKSFNSLPSIGHSATPIRLGDLGFVGLGYGPDFPKGVYISIPSITRSGQPSLQTDDVPTFEIPFDCNVAPGFTSPVQYYLLP